MSVTKTTTALICLLALSACDISGASNVDSGIDDDSLEGMQAGIWIDGNGCDHWIIDDGIEGYMTPRFGSNGKPVCRDGSVPFSTVNFNRTFFGLN